MIEAGDLDEQITIEERTATQDTTLGTYTYAWSEVATVWADVYEIMGTERMAEGLNIANRPIQVTIRYRNGLTSDMRVLWRGNTYRITRGPTEIGRREGLKMICELKTTEGDEA